MDQIKTADTGTYALLKGHDGDSYIAFRGLDEGTWRVNRLDIQPDTSVRLVAMFTQLSDLREVERAIAEFEQEEAAYRAGG
jgi:hypothetical protein